MTDCAHENFSADCKVARLTDHEAAERVGAFMLEVTVKCVQCGTPFQFLGLQQGYDIGGATCSFDRTEARLTISPDGLPPTTGVKGFKITHVPGGGES